MIRQTVNALIASVVTFALCAVAYPAAAWGLGQLLFPTNADGSLLYRRDRTVLGSALVAQPFASDGYFHPRPSAVDHDASATGGSNLGPRSPKLREQVAERTASLGATDEHPAPPDLVTASGSGIDPHVSPEAARFQARRVAEARGLPIDRVLGLIEQHVERSGFVIGAPPRVNVLRLNLALDDAQ
ncbi:potassium-transporting ATPase subunit KdpC [Tautonia plasticadhaerens]|uniref:Potassium-transporting ATPase KdpC subunit n=1 Tax=Tautonia plasticadhaerens TaxID=2527974 RepID=A0A518HEA6_9BACT|nr:potassium-transporting ATPase subunit KdpC [Tautonia plasticadhaerens]QDV39177.1 Potassium-transporting ATPase C chain [Tautonia plasticadhaerens]